jgi:hypothetical protein
MYNPMQTNIPGRTCLMKILKPLSFSKVNFIRWTFRCKFL